MVCLTHLSCRSALISTYTVVGSGPEVPWETPTTTVNTAGSHNFFLYKYYHCTTAWQKTLRLQLLLLLLLPGHSGCYCLCISAHRDKLSPHRRGRSFCYESKDGIPQNLYNIYRMVGTTMWERQQWGDFRRKSAKQNTDLNIKKRYRNIKKKLSKIRFNWIAMQTKSHNKTLLDGRKEGKVIASQGKRKLEESGDDDVAEWVHPGT